MTATGVSYVPAGAAAVYTGAVTGVSGQRVVALVSAPTGAPLRLVFDLAIDEAAGTVSGTVDASPATAG